MSTSSPGSHNLETVTAVRELLDNPASWPNLTSADLQTFVHHTIAIYGVSNDPFLIRRVQSLYEHYRSRISEPDRLELLSTMVDNVSNGSVSLNALLPFLLRDDSPAVVSTATIDFVSLHPLESGDPLTGPKAATAILRRDLPRNRAGIFAGLLQLGDRRVCDLLGPLRSEIKDGDLSDIARNFSGFAFTAAVDFFLDWLEITSDTANSARFAYLCAAMVRIGHDALSYPDEGEPSIVEGERMFPVPKGGEGPAVRIIRKYTVREFGSVIAPRLRALGDREHGDRLIPAVMEAWGVNHNGSVSGPRPR